MALFGLLTVNSDKDDNEWLKHVKENLKKDEKGGSETNSHVCIFGIAHPFLRLLKPEAYTPQVISIGPYHHKPSKQYEQTNGYKLKMARTLESSLDSRSRRLSITSSQMMKESGPAMTDISYSKEMLSWMLALDTSFILQFLNSIYRPHALSVGGVKELDSKLLSKRKTSLWHAITNDILMLENQVPMFLLIEALYLTTKADIEMGSPNQIDMSLDIAKLYQEGGHLAAILQAACAHFNPFVRQKDSLQPPLGLNGARHLLDYLYYYVTANCHVVDRPSENLLSTTAIRNLPSATELISARIKFASYSSGNLKEIKFKRKTSTLRLPKITINASTEVVLRNLVALESNQETKQKPLTRYVYLMDCLINKEKDVAVLKKYGILDSQMSSNAEVAQMWNSMGMLLEVNAFDPIDTALEAAKKNYKSKHLRVLLVEFQKLHCSKPWMAVAVLSAGMMMLLTAIQVFCLFYTCNTQSASN